MKLSDIVESNVTDIQSGLPYSRVTPIQRSLSRNEHEDVKDALISLNDAITSAKTVTANLPAEIAFPVELEDLHQSVQRAVPFIEQYIQSNIIPPPVKD